MADELNPPAIPIEPPPLEPPPPEPPPPAPRGPDTVIRGFLMGVGMHILVVLGSVVFGPLVLVTAFGIGLTQFLYLVPLYMRWKKDWPLHATGLLICMGVTFLLNAACWGVLLQS